MADRQPGHGQREQGGGERGEQPQPDRGAGGGGQGTDREGGRGAHHQPVRKARQRHPEGEYDHRAEPGQARYGEPAQPHRHSRAGGARTEAGVAAPAVPAIRAAISDPVKSFVTDPIW